MVDATLPGSRLEHEGAEAGGATAGPFATVLRSKGFVWVAPEGSVAYYWSHAGRHVELSELGRWWAAVPREDWPEAHHASILEDFDTASEGGDRRQEIVFIGTKLNEAGITKALDECLCTDAELEEYRAVWSAEQDRIDVEHGPFRFAVGDAVECAMGAGMWQRGKVVAQHGRMVKTPGSGTAGYLWLHLWLHL